MRVLQQPGAIAQPRRFSDRDDLPFAQLRRGDKSICLISDAFGMTPALARMYRASGQAIPVGKRILELNPKHSLVIGLQQNGDRDVRQAATQLHMYKSTRNIAKRLREKIMSLAGR